MKKYWELFKAMLATVLLIYLFFSVVFFAYQRRWEELAQFLVYAGVGLVLEHWEIPETLIWKFKKVIKEFKKNGE